MSEADAILDDLLSRWHWWQLGEKLCDGFLDHSLVVGDVRPTHLQYDGQLEAVEEDAESARMGVIDHEIRETKEPYRTSLYINARNLCAGSAVFSSPRIPEAEWPGVLAEARSMLIRRLTASGVMESTNFPLQAA